MIDFNQTVLAKVQEAYEKGFEAGRKSKDYNVLGDEVIDQIITELRAQNEELKAKNERLQTEVGRIAGCLHNIRMEQRAIKGPWPGPTSYEIAAKAHRHGLTVDEYKKLISRQNLKV